MANFNSDSYALGLLESKFLSANKLELDEAAKYLLLIAKLQQMANPNIMEFIKNTYPQLLL